MFIVTGPSSGLAERIWEKIPHHSGSSWSGEPGEDYDNFLPVLINSKAILLYSFGFVRVEQFTPQGTALCHPIIWSPSIFRSKEEALKGFNELCSIFDILTLSFMIPDFIPSLHRLANSLGLTYTSKYGMPDGTSGSIYIYVPRRT